MAKPTSRRESFLVTFGEGEQRWSFPDPAHPIVDMAQWRTRYGQPLERASSDALVLADTVSALHYLIHVCPTTKLACEKLAAMRAAVRELGPVEKENVARIERRRSGRRKA
jgi:hypothetical protein